MTSLKRFLVVGAGFSGAVVARELAESLPCSVVVRDERPHIAGNCHTERDPATGVMLHAYGPHIFNTDNDRVWEYVQRFGRFRPYIHRVKAVTARGVFSLPLNLLTINQFFGKRFSPAEAREFVAGLGDQTIGEPRNFEELALKSFGRDLAETFFLGYTRKQWGCDPADLPASVLKRLPVRFNYDDNYYSKKHQGIPEDGYTAIIQRILDHPSIAIELNHRFEPEEEPTGTFDHIFHTGAIDAFFGYRFGRLSYRTVGFERIDAEGDFQGAAQVNYPDPAVPWTRIIEHKHFAPWESHERTVAFREFSHETGVDDIPYYPKRLAPDLKLLAEYQKLAEFRPAVSFLGRLATYRYMDMETVIGEALEFAANFVARARKLIPAGFIHR